MEELTIIKAGLLGGIGEFISDQSLSAVGALVLLVVGKTDRSLISRHKRTRNDFIEEDYDLLCQVLEGFTEFQVTPNILTEASNLVSQIGDPDRGRVLATLRGFIEGSREHYVPSTEAASIPSFPRLGLTDTATLAHVSYTGHVLTSDLDLYLEVSRAGHRAVNFNHIRQGSWSWG